MRHKDFFTRYSLLVTFAFAIAVATLLVLNAYESTPPLTSHASRYVVLSLGMLATTTLAATAYYCYAPRWPKPIPQQDIKNNKSPLFAKVPKHGSRSRSWQNV